MRERRGQSRPWVLGHGRSFFNVHPPDLERLGSASRGELHDPRADTAGDPGWMIGGLRISSRDDNASPDKQGRRTESEEQNSRWASTTDSDEQPSSASAPGDGDGPTVPAAGPATARQDSSTMIHSGTSSPANNRPANKMSVIWWTSR